MERPEGHEDCEPLKAPVPGVWVCEYAFEDDDGNLTECDEAATHSHMALTYWGEGMEFRYCCGHAPPDD